MLPSGEFQQRDQDRQYRQPPNQPQWHQHVPDVGDLRLVIPNPQPLAAVKCFVKLHLMASRLHRPLVKIVFDDRIDFLPPDADHDFPARTINPQPRLLTVPMPDAADAITSPMHKSGGDGNRHAKSQQTDPQPSPHFRLTIESVVSCCPAGLLPTAFWALQAWPSASFQSQPAAPGQWPGWSQSPRHENLASANPTCAFEMAFAA